MTTRPSPEEAKKLIATIESPQAIDYVLNLLESEYSSKRKVLLRSPLYLGDVIDLSGETYLAITTERIPTGITFQSEVKGRILDKSIDLKIETTKIDSAHDYETSTKGKIANQDIDDHRTSTSAPGLLRNLKFFPDFKSYDF